MFDRWCISDIEDASWKKDQGILYRHLHEESQAE